MDEEAIKGRILFGNGYGKPPQESQFKKGQSGNPSGRPKTVPSEFSFTDQRTLNIILDIADRDIPVRENGEVKTMKMLEVAINALYVRSGKGDPRALATLLGLTQKAEIAQAQHIKERNALWSAYKERETAKMEEAKEKREPIPTPLPHPDDIIIDYDKGPRFLGPCVKEEQAMIDHTLRMRDLLILQSELDHRSTTRLDGEPLTEPGGADLLAMVLDQQMPPRLRLSEWEWTWRMMKAEGLPKRVLLKQLYEGWRKLGHPHPRGYVFPDMSRVKRAIEQCMAIAREVQKLPSPSRMKHGEWKRMVANVVGGQLAGE